MDFSQSPYFDDFDAEKNYTKILCVPGRTSQARETTQIQTLLQDQITKLGNTIYDNGTVLGGCRLTSSPDRLSVSISPGSVYADGKIITFSTDVLIDIEGVSVEVIGIIKEEIVITEESDSSLKDPAIGYENFNEPGAHRLKETWYWAKIYDEGIGIFILEDGVIKPQTKKDPLDPKPITQTENILDIIARRDYQKSGNYLLSGLKCSLTEHPTDRFLKKQLIVSSGTARLLGYDITLMRDVQDEVNIASGTSEILREPWSYTAYNASSGLGGNYRAGNRPVASIDRVTATFLVVDGEDGLPSVTRGGTAGGSDELSYSSVDSIVAVNQGGTWNPATESFDGGTTYSSISYLLDGNNIDWSPSGLGISEPDIGSSYKVAYKGFKTLTKEIVTPVRVINEIVTHGDATGNNALAHSFVCEDNDYTGYQVLISDYSATPPDPDNESYVPNYVNGTDYVIDSTGNVDWYDHDIQILEITKGTANGVDALVGFSNSYLMGTILDVAYYSSLPSMSFDRATNTFISPTTSYTLTTDYTYTQGNAQINWSPAGAEPSGDTYFVAVRARKYKTLSHPVIGERFYITYYYWSTEVAGDYLARDSFYKTWISEDNIGNELQRFGLDLQDYINFWRSENFRNGSGNYGRIYPNTLVEVDYNYYTPRYVLICVNNDDPIKIIYGESSDNPKEPVYSEDSSNLIIAKIYCPADSLLMSLTNLGVQTLKVTDLHKMKNQISVTEVNLASTWLDLDAKSIPISNKKGIMTTSFTSNERLDIGWADTAYSIDPYWEELAMPHVDSFYSLSIDLANTTTQTYSSLCSVVPSGTDSIEQSNYTGTESIAPYALAGQTALEQAPSAYMTIFPTSDTLIIPRTQVFGGLTDANAWVASDVAKLSNPTKWFSKGWTGGTETRSFDNAYVVGVSIVTELDTQTETWTANYIRDIQGNCRQIEITWNVPGGMIPTSEAQLDYFIYFGGVLVTPTLTNSTPPGSLPASFRPVSATNGASGTFTIPPNIPEGRIEVKIISTPMTILDNLWRQTIVVTYDAAIVEQLTMQFTQCRCNCYCNCWCNCYNCRGRCGTGPLAQTMEPIGRKRVLKEIGIDFSKVHPTYGVYGCIIKTDNGQPTSNTVSTGMISRKLLTAAQLVGAGMKTFTFEDPVFLNDEAYAIVVTGEDRFNLNSINEVAAGHDIRCKIATLGQVDLLNGLVVGTQPFKAGILWRSLTGVTWEQDQKSDLKFKATFNTYPSNTSYYVYMNPVSVENATAFLCTWDSMVYDGTSIVFEYKTPAGKWLEFSPYTLTYIDEVSNVLEFRAKLLTQVSSISPFCTQFAGLYVQSQGTELKAVTKSFELNEDSDTCDIYLDSHLPVNCEQHIGITFDNGVSWVNLDNNLEGRPTGNLIEYSPVDLNANNIKYRHHWRINLDSPNTFTTVRVGIVSIATGPNPKLKDPRFSKLIVIASTT